VSRIVPYRRQELRMDPGRSKPRVPSVSPFPQEGLHGPSPSPAPDTTAAKDTGTFCAALR